MKSTLLVLAAVATITVACQRDVGRRASNATLDDRASISDTRNRATSGTVEDDTMDTRQGDQSATVQSPSRKQDQRSEHFKVLSATSRRWASGVASGGRGIDYSFNVQITTTQRISFDTAWISNHPYAIAVSKEVGRVSSQPVTISNGDQIVLLVSIMLRKGVAADEAETSIEHADQARIMYRVDGRQAFVTVSNIQPQRSQSRP